MGKSKLRRANKPVFTRSPSTKKGAVTQLLEYSQEKVVIPIENQCNYPSCHDPIWRAGYCKFHYDYEHYTSK